MFLSVDIAPVFTYFVPPPYNTPRRGSQPFLCKGGGGFENRAQMSIFSFLFFRTIWKRQEKGNQSLYCIEYASSRLISEVKRHGAWILPEWVTMEDSGDVRLALCGELAESPDNRG